ncbi:hypothetical protein A2U01_0102979, partial [Trifolium medium]|nr:hypothetical protein [Trifolium medium]
RIRMVENISYVCCSCEARLGWFRM